MQEAVQLLCRSSIFIYKHSRKRVEGDGEKTLAETPLHRAAAAGNTAVAVEIMKLKPLLAMKLNPEGLSPLHVAIKEEQKHTAKALAGFNKELVHVQGKGGITPLMLCAILHSYQILAILLLECPKSVSDVNNRNQTIVHIAMESGNCDTVCVIIDWLIRTNKVWSVLSIKDDEGNTALHAAAKFGCTGGMRRILNLVKLNRRNSDDMTALDVAESYNNMEVVKLLKDKGALKHSEPPSHATSVEYVLSKPTAAEAIARAYYYLTNELTFEVRNVILVVASIIMTGTYQMVLQPAAGIYPPANNETTTAASLPLSATGEKPHEPGQMVMGWKQYRFYMPFNTLAFMLSAAKVILVVPATPIFIILLFCMAFMCLSYLWALDAISYYTDVSDMVYFMAFSVIFGALVVKFLSYPFKALLVEEDWWLRHFNVNFSNWWERIGGGYTTAANTMRMQRLLLSRA